jgi:hypothetical protein
VGRGAVHVRCPWHYHGRDAEPDVSLYPPVSLAEQRAQRSPARGVSRHPAAALGCGGIRGPIMAGPAAMSTARAILVVVPTSSRDTQLLRAGAFSGSVSLGIVR